MMMHAAKVQEEKQFNDLDYEHQHKKKIPEM